MLIRGRQLVVIREKSSNNVYHKTSIITQDNSFEIFITDKDTRRGGELRLKNGVSQLIQLGNQAYRSEIMNRIYMVESFCRLRWNGYFFRKMCNCGLQMPPFRPSDTIRVRFTIKMKILSFWSHRESTVITFLSDVAR